MYKIQIRHECGAVETVRYGDDIGGAIEDARLHAEYYGESAAIRILELRHGRDGTGVAEIVPARR